MLYYPNISVITVTLNPGIEFEKSISSVREQTYQYLEHIIIDGGSTDRTLDIINCNKSRITYFISEPDKGIYHAMNKGLLQVNGDYVFFLNGDDFFIDNDVVSDVASIIKDHPDIDVVYGDQIFDQGGRQTVKIHPCTLDKIYLAKTTVQHQTMFVKNDLFKVTKGFSEKYKIVSDYDWILKVFLILHCKYIHIERNISVMSTHGISWTSNFESERIHVMKKYYSIWEILRYRTLPLRFMATRRFIINLFNIFLINHKDSYTS